MNLYLKDDINVINHCYHDGRLVARLQKLLLGIASRNKGKRGGGDGDAGAGADSDTDGGESRPPGGG